MNLRKSNDIFNTRIKVYARDFYTCQYQNCKRGIGNLELAHRIANTKDNLKYIIRFWKENYDEELNKKEAQIILNHPLNLVTSCRKHNSYLNIGNNPEARDKLLREIKENL